MFNNTIFLIAKYYKRIATFFNYKNTLISCQKSLESLKINSDDRSNAGLDSYNVGSDNWKKEEISFFVNFYWLQGFEQPMLLIIQIMWCKPIL